MRLSGIFFLFVILPGVLFAEFVICDVQGVQMEPAVAFDGANYVVVWNDASGSLTRLYAARVTEAGVVIDTGGVRLLNEFDLQAHPELAYDGTNFLIVWQFGC